jgi:hypothetical protein
MKILSFFEFPSGAAYVKLENRACRCVPSYIWKRKKRNIGDELEEYIIYNEEPIHRNDGICPRRNTCAFLKCPPNWKDCSVPNVLTTVSDWLYGSEFTTKGEEHEREE